MGSPGEAPRVPVPAPTWTPLSISGPTRTAPTHPPLLVLLPVHDDHVALGEGQLVRVVGHAVVQRFDPLRLQPGLREGRRGQRLAWPGGTAMSRELGPGALTTGAGESWEGPEEEGEMAQPRRAGNMAAGAWCAQVLSPGAVERGPRPPAGRWRRVLPDWSWVQEEATPLPNQGKRGRSASSEPPGNKPQRAYYGQSRGRARRVGPLTVCDFLGMGAGGCTAAGLDRGPRASVPERSTALGPKRINSRYAPPVITVRHTPFTQKP